MAEITYKGEKFELPAQPPTIALMEYAATAVAYPDGSLVGLAALYSLLEECIGEENWPRFKELARQESEEDDLFEVVKDVYAAHAERPTSRPSDSSDGPDSTAPKSADVSSLPVKERYEAEGRPAWALQVVQAQEARQAV